MAGIVSYGAYIPFNRLLRSEIAKAWGGSASGEKAVAGPDEDALTMAVAAAIDCVKGMNPEDIEGVYFASTTSPYREKQAAATIAQVLNLKNPVWTTDFSGSLRSGTNALKAALDAVESGSLKNILVCASELRLAHPGGDKEMSFGDGAAALLIGSGKVAAEIEGSYTHYNELIDVWRSDEDRYVRSWEDVFIYAKGYSSFVSETVLSALRKFNLTSQDFSRVAFYSPNAHQLSVLAKKLGFDLETQVQDVLHSTVGNTGGAMALMSLVAVLEEAKANDRLLLASYGDGCDVFILRVTEEIANTKDRLGIKGHLASKQILTNYNKYLNWREHLKTEPPRRVRLERPSAAALLRDNKSGLAFYGVKCRNCGTPQYPPQRICLNCGSKDKFEDYCFADKIGKVTAFSHDMLGVSLDPPITGATIDFEGGGRIKLDMTDRIPEEVSVGMEVEMTFRKLRYVDGIYGYWWKCRPIRS
jgi:3-hydroxy-3-methylglutaryl CoA synthase